MEQQSATKSDTNVNDREVWNLREYLIPEKRHNKAKVSALLHDKSEDMRRTQKLLIGYQVNLTFNYAEELAMFVDLSGNNVGDPFERGSFHLNSKEFEYAVLQYYAKLWNFPPRSLDIDERQSHAQLQPDNTYFGYVLSMGSSEGNLMSFWTARDYIAGKDLIRDKQKRQLNDKHLQEKPSAWNQLNCSATMRQESQHRCVELKQTVYFASSASHYSVFKAADIVGLPSFNEYGDVHYADAVIEGVKARGEPFPKHVPVYSAFDGRVHADKLLRLVDFFAEKGHGIVVVLNYGTTFTGAFDELHTLVPRLGCLFDTHGQSRVERRDAPATGKRTLGRDAFVKDTRKAYWIHVDAALGGDYLSYLKAYADKHLSTEQDPDPVLDTVMQADGTRRQYRLSDLPCVDFRRYRQLSSIVMSGHKFVGMPWPCGVYMTRNEHQVCPPSAPMYIGSTDTTLAGSRNALSPLLFWTKLSTVSDAEMQQQAYNCLQLAREAEVEIRSIAREKSGVTGLEVQVNRSAFSFSVTFSKLADWIKRKYVLAQQDLEGRAFCHLFVMDHVVSEPDLLRRLYDDMRANNSFQAELDQQQLALTMESEGAASKTKHTPDAVHSNQQLANNAIITLLSNQLSSLRMLCGQTRDIPVS